MSETVDSYRTQRLKTLDGARKVAMGRLWEMAREGVATRSRMGVTSLTYETDLIPGTRNVILTADLWGVTLKVYGYEWSDAVLKHGPVTDDPMTLRLDETWLLNQSPATA